MASPVEELRAAVEAVTAELGNGAVTPTLERPRQAGHGDFSTNAAMLLAKSAGAPPREIATRPDGAATRVSSPFKTTNAFERDAASRAYESRARSISLESTPSSRPSSPACGVSTVGQRR